MTTDLLDFQLAEFISNTYTPELTEEIETAFELMYGFELPDPETDFINLITSDSYLATDDIQDQFTLLLHTKLDYLLNQHHLTLSEDATLSVKVQILSACFAVMYLEDYGYIINILESDITDIEKFSAIISEYSLLTTEDVLSNTIEVKPVFLKALSNFVYTRDSEVNTEIDTLSFEIIENTKLLRDIVGFETVGYMLLKDKVLTGLDIENYISFIGDVEDLPNSSVDVLAAHVLSIILLTKNSLNGVLLTYRKNSRLLVTDPHLVTAVDVKLIELIAKLIDYKKVKKESLAHDQS